MISFCRLLSAAAFLLALAGCARSTPSAEDPPPGQNRLALRTAARAVVRSVASKPVKVAMTAERVGEAAAKKLANPPHPTPTPNS